MAGSVAEERIREKVVAALRARKPEARIIHELVLTQGGERIDVAAVWPAGLILAEIKSERDTLSRLQAQLRSAGAFECEVWLCLAEKWRPAIEAMQTQGLNHRRAPIRADDPDMRLGYTLISDPNPCHVPELSRGDLHVRFETDEGLSPIRMHSSWMERARSLNGRALLNMLWADELRRLTGLGSRASRGTCIVHAQEYMTGSEIRRSVCAALMARAFPRADAPSGAGAQHPGLFRAPAQSSAQAVDVEGFMTHAVRREAADV